AGLAQQQLERASARARDDDAKHDAQRLRDAAQRRREEGDRAAARTKTAKAKNPPMHDHDGRAKRQLAKLTGKDVWAVKQSAAIGKRAIYILPLYPALAILTALAVLELMDSDRVKWRKRTGLVWVTALFLLGVAPHVLPFTGHGDKYTAGAVFVSFATLSVAAVSLVYVLRTECRRLHAVMAASAALLFAGAAFVVFPAMDPYKSAEHISAPVRALSERGADYDLFCVGFSREEYVYYSKKFHEPVLTDLVGKASIPPEELAHAARVQIKGKSVISHAVEDVPIADLASPTSEERAALEAALHQALAEQEEKLAGALQFEDDLRAELAAFAEKLQSGRPAFFFVQDDDWRWIAALLPETLKLHGLVQREVGRRHALLLANEPGKALLDRLGVAY
ncbi:MAG TPA: hypothetical protein P5141_07955, partial [Candidatus Hydrogenedentes bacterium]|nr:hypothetical protein [Candidatus Hydrogenedentota bacterium]